MFLSLTGILLLWILTTFIAFEHSNGSFLLVGGEAGSVHCIFQYAATRYPTWPFPAGTQVARLEPLIIMDPVFPKIEHYASSNTIDILLPLWLPLLPLLFLAVYMRRHRGAQAGFCKKCGYCLRGLRSMRCPECGTEAESGSAMA